MVYTHYLQNGDMEDDWNFLNLHGPTGVGQYDATWERIEAEWFMVATNVDKLQINHAANNTNAAFAVRFSDASSTIFFPNVANLPVRGTMILKLVQHEGRVGGGALAVHAQANGSGGSRGPLLANCSVTGRARVTCPLDSSEVRRAHSGSSGTSIDLLFAFEPSSGVGSSDVIEASETASVQLDSWSVASSI